MSRNQITIRRPDDFHVHLRQGVMLNNVARHTAKVFGRALVMPNLIPPVITSRDAKTYEKQVMDSPEVLNSGFKPLMTIKLTDKTAPETVSTAKRDGVIAAKLYPAGVTTNSDDGIGDIDRLSPVLEVMERDGMVLCLHGETPGIFCMDREKAFLDTLRSLVRQFPNLRMVLEHVTTADAVAAIRDMENVAATITIHHLILTLDDVVGDMLNPHNFCKPIAKTDIDRTMLVAAATGALPHSDKFFLGTDSAPHLVESKHCASGCAGVYSAPVAMGLLAEIFEDGAGAGWVDALEAFASLNGAAFYGLEPNESKLVLKKKTWKVPSTVDGVVPLLAGEEIAWMVEE